MSTDVSSHYSGSGDLAEAIASGLEKAGKTPGDLKTSDLAAIDEFHIRGRKATLEVGNALGLDSNTSLLDLGSGLGGPARTLAETFGCSVTGIDLTEEFCKAANAMSSWLGLAEKVRCVHGDATDLPFPEGAFDAAMTIHVAMNIPDKAGLYREARRAVKPGGRFAVYDVIQGEGGGVHFPVPWAREPSLSHLASDAEMRSLLEASGFRLHRVEDSSAESLEWFRDRMREISRTGPPPVSFAMFLGEDYPQMVQNQVRNLEEDRIRTITYICDAPS